MLWFLFCFCGSSDGFQRLRNRKYFIFRFDDHHHNKIVAISVIGSVIRMNGVPPRAARNDDRQLRRPLASPVLWGILHSRPPRASLCRYCAVVRTPLHSPTTDAAVPLAFSPPQQRLASSHFFLLAPQVLVPIVVDHCLRQRVPECSAPPAPAW